MKPCSQAVANYFLDIVDKNSREISLLAIMKCVYLVQGFSLALFDKSALNSNFDVVEAWKYGPVVPSLYHEFKRFGKKPITNYKATVLDDNFELKEAKLCDSEIKRACQFVWNSFKDYSEWEMVKFTHKKNSPWDQVYVEGQNKIIEDQITKEYFERLLKDAKDQING
jgi:uncharacterized phage-associated protein